MEASTTAGDTAGADSVFSLRDTTGGVVLLSWQSGVIITADLAARAMIKVDEHNTDGERPLLVDMTRIAALRREAHRHFRQRSRVSRIAIVGESAVDRVIANFGLRLSPPPVPSRFFTSKAAALTWLQGAAS